VVSEPVRREGLSPSSTSLASGRPAADATPKVLRRSARKDPLLLGGMAEQEGMRALPTAGAPSWSASWSVAYEVRGDTSDPSPPTVVIDLVACFSRLPVKERPAASLSGSMPEQL
jgi:hypothetical protein